MKNDHVPYHKIALNQIRPVLRCTKLLLLNLVFLACVLHAQEIPLNDLLYPVNDYGFTLAPSGNYMASIKKLPNGNCIIITDIKASAVKNNIFLGEHEVSNLNWISENRVSYEQAGLLFAINIDGTENQQLMSLWKEEKKRYYSVNSLIDNYQTTKLVNVLENDFEHILIETRGIDDFPIIYKLNIFTGEKEEIENGNNYDINKWLVDRNGHVRLGVQDDEGKIRFFTKNNEGKWESRNELNLDTDGNSFINQKLHFMGFDYDTNIIYLASSMDNPRWRILTYDIQKKSYLDTVLEDGKYDVGNPVDDNTKLLFLDSESKLAGIRYEREIPFTKWFNKKFQAHEDSLKKRYPEYFAEIFDWNKDASIVLVKLYSNVDPGHIIIYNSNNAKCGIFCSFAPNLINYVVSYSKVIRYKTRDNYEIEGYLNLPPKKEKNVPFVIIPHGGPWVRDYWDYDPVVQFFANHGYGILKMNFRGSAGYGINHLLSGIKKISSIMIDDITDGTKWLINQGYADTSNIFLYGHSYGGYAALQSIIYYPELYHAAVCVAAPTDIVKLIDYYEEEKNKFSYEFWKTTVGNPDKEDEYLENISPFYNIKMIKRPVFLFHGEKDETIPVSQTENFVKEAEDIGIKIDHKIIKDEDHSISANRNTEFILRKSIQFYKEHSTEIKQGN